MRMIDADALEKSLLEKGFYPAIVKRVIEDAPTVDAVEVVRCKDCIYRNHVTQLCHMHSQEYDGGMYWDMFPDDHFCSDGERRCEEDGESELD